MSRHFQLLLFSIFLYVFGHTVGRSHADYILLHFSKITFLLIAIRIFLNFNVGVLRLPLIAFLSYIVGWFAGGVSKAPYFADYGFAFFLMGVAPFYVLSALAINEYREYWKSTIYLRAGMAALVGYGLLVIFNMFVNLKVPHLSGIQMMLCLGMGYLISYGTFYLYRWEAEKLDGNLPLTFFIGVPVVRAIMSQKREKIRVVMFSVLESIYVPILATTILIAKFHQYDCLILLNIGWSGSQNDEALAKCAPRFFNPDEYITAYILMCMIICCSLLVLNSVKHARTIILSLLAASSLLVVLDNMNFALAAFLLPLSALLISKKVSR